MLQIASDHRPLRVLAVATLMFSGCATPVKVDSSPQGASVTVAGKVLGKTPTEWQVESSAKPIEVAFALEGYFPEQVTYGAGTKPTAVFVTLEPRTLAKTFEIRTEPARATVRLNGRDVGVSPLTLPIQFVRDHKDAAWAPQQLTFQLPNFESETITLQATAVRPTSVSSWIRSRRSPRCSTPPTSS